MCLSSSQDLLPFQNYPLYSCACRPEHHQLRSSTATLQHQFIFLAPSVCRPIRKETEEMEASKSAEEAMLLSLCNMVCERLGGVWCVLAGAQLRATTNLSFVRCYEFSKSHTLFHLQIPGLCVV